MAVTYSLAKDKDKKISPNFKAGEFVSRDGADKILIDERLVLVLQAIRAHFDKPLVINSGYRTAAHNQAVGGAKDSFHMRGEAADIVIKGVPHSEVADFAEKLLLSGGVGRYVNFTHVDVRAVRTRWVG